MVSRYLGALRLCLPCLTLCLFVLCLIAVASTGCGADSAAAMAGKGDSYIAADAGASSRCYGANDCPPGYMCNEFGYCTPLKTDAGLTPDGYLPPEVEQDREPPASGKYYVYVAVPAQDMVVKIHSATLQVRSIKVGKDPGALRTIPGQDVAVVLGRLNATATILRSKADGGDDVVTLDTAEDLNSLALSPSGKHAVAYFDVAKSQGQLSPKQTFQEVSVLGLEAGKEYAVKLSVGFRPTGVQFSADGNWAYVITEQGISLVDLVKTTTPTIVPTIPVLKDPIKETKLEEVLVTPDGKYALARRTGLGGMRVVDLATKSIQDIPLGDDPTDLDLTEDGKLAVAVLRQTNLVVLADIPDDLADPTGLDLLNTGVYVAGQATLTKDGKRAFLYTNATDQEVLLVADLVNRTIDVHPLQKGVRTVLSSPDGTVALILHNKVPGTPSVQEGFETYVDKSFGYSLHHVATSFDKLQLTDTDPGEVAFAPDGKSAYLLLSETAQGIRSVEAIDLGAFLVTSVALGSPPVALGVIATTGSVYVAQDHPLGRVTFVEMATHATKTVTGFELNSHIVE